MNTVHQGPAPGPPADSTAGDAIGPDERGATPGGRAAGQTSALLQVGVVVAIVVYLWQFGPRFLETSTELIGSCVAGNPDVYCFTDQVLWRYGLWPVLAILAALSLLRGAAVEHHQRPGRGAVLSLMALAALGLSLLWGLT